MGFAIEATTLLAAIHGQEVQKAVPRSSKHLQDCTSTIRPGLGQMVQNPIGPGRPKKKPLS